MATVESERYGDSAWLADGQLVQASEREPFLFPESEPGEEEPEREEKDGEKDPFLIPESEPAEDEPEREDEDGEQDPFLIPESEPAEEEPDSEPERSSD